MEKMLMFEVMELPEEVPCVSKVGPESKRLDPRGKPCETMTRQALLIAGLPNMGKRKVQMPACETHIKIYLQEAKGKAIVNEGPIPQVPLSMACDDCGRPHMSQDDCPAGPRKVF